jgi:uncharacterized membrane protein
MIQSAGPLDRIVEDYLAAVARACQDLPAGRREELISDLREHIAVARGELASPTEAALRTILDRLGDPAAIAHEARMGEPIPSAPGPTAPLTPSPLSRSGGSQAPLILAIVLGFALALIILVIGVVAMIQPASVSPHPAP